MPEKRRRRPSPPRKGLAAGEKLNRQQLVRENCFDWDWVGTEVEDASEISNAHRLRACGLSKNGTNPFCANKYAPVVVPDTEEGEGEKAADDSVIVVSDNDEPVCTKKRCRDNPHCLNYLGQEKWEKQKQARESFLGTCKLGDNPSEDNRDSNLPVGLRNLGATCYANAFLQVWFQDLAFRNGVYQCQPLGDRTKYEDSPIFQLQVTFTALQLGNQTVFNPEKLVESLKLDMSEQQDAQEFSKLFMSHLDTEFKKQSNPRLRTLLPDQFQGSLTYATVCKKCNHRSERASDFLELEVNLKSNCKLEERLEALLAPETLSDDNQYLCSNCETLQDATRYTELRTLPPVLHISLLRFVYDLANYERKKSKHNIMFPPYLDMGRFLSNRGPSPSDQGDSGETYELRGVLLHKGPSAYHGHYEAQVYDVTARQWYQFNDEEVSKVDSFHAPKKQKSADVEDEIDLIDKGKRSARAKKKRRIDDSDGETPNNPVNDNGASTLKYLASRDAYMLIYARAPSSRSSKTESFDQPSNGPVDSSSNTKQASNSLDPSSNLPTPPERAKEVVAAMNETHQQDCAAYSHKEKEALERFRMVRDAYRDIYLSWSLASTEEESVLLSRPAIEEWLAAPLSAPLSSKPNKEARKSADETQGSPTTNGTTTTTAAIELAELNGSTDQNAAEFRNSTKKPFDNSAISCVHGRLDPMKAPEMKRIRASALQRMIEISGREFEPILTPEDICVQCMESEFQERLYTIRHPTEVQEFDSICETSVDKDGFWISKLWLKDWRQAKPRMHVRSLGDPPPDAPEYLRHVSCEHGQLCLNFHNRRKISTTGMEFLRQLYPTWNPLSWDAEPCPVCATMVHLSKEDKQIMRKKAETEKALLRRLHDTDVFGGKALRPNVAHAIINPHFLRAWRSWLLRPGDRQRPEALDNSWFLCEHDKLNFNPNNPSDLCESVATVTLEEWRTLEELYSAGPFLEIYAVPVESDSATSVDIKTGKESCEECRRKRKLTFEFAQVTLLLLKLNDPVPTGESNGKDHNLVNGSEHPPDWATSLASASTTSNGQRQSRRIRENKDRGRRKKIEIQKKMTVKDVKIVIQKEYKIPTISQRLYHRGRELQNSQTVEDLEILEEDELYLKEEEENIDALKSDAEDKPSKRRKEGNAFGGTLLGRHSPSPAPVSREPSMPMDVDPEPPVLTNGAGVGFIECQVCTLHNPIANTICAACETPLLDGTDGLDEQ